MHGMNLYFHSTSQDKINEVKEILNERGIEIKATDPAHAKTEELQTEDLEKLVCHKLIAAFSTLGRPVLVEHTALYLAALGGLPGGLTQIFWKKLQAKGLLDLIAHATDRSASAKTMVGYCDGKKIWTFMGEVKGKIPEKPAGSGGFGWDSVFVPEGSTQTFAEMGAEKSQYSTRQAALKKFADHFKRAL